MQGNQNVQRIIRTRPTNGNGKQAEPIRGKQWTRTDKRQPLNFSQR